SFAESTGITSTPTPAIVACQKRRMRPHLLDQQRFSRSHVRDRGQDEWSKRPQVLDPVGPGSDRDHRQGGWSHAAGQMRWSIVIKTSNTLAARRSSAPFLVPAQTSPDTV